jgi:ribosome-binding protein aMBF1 (putative translation factor)
MARRPEKVQELRLVLDAGIDNREVGRMLRQIRDAVGMSQGDLAAKIDTKYQNLSRLEHGRAEYETQLSTINRYVRGLGWELVLVARPQGGDEA